MSKQRRSTLLPKTATIEQCRTSFALKFRPFDKVERCFDTVAQNGNIVEAVEINSSFEIGASLEL